MSVQKDPEGTERRILLEFGGFEGRRVLELGCGEGRMTWQYAGRSQSVTGLDPDPKALRVARLDAPHGPRGRVRFICGSAAQIPFSSNSFECVILSWSL